MLLSVKRIQSTIFPLYIPQIRTNYKPVRNNAPAQYLALPAVGHKFWLWGLVHNRWVGCAQTKNPLYLPFAKGENFFASPFFKGGLRGILTGPLFLWNYTGPGLFMRANQRPGVPGTEGIIGHHISGMPGLRGASDIPDLNGGRSFRTVYHHRAACRERGRRDLRPGKNSKQRAARPCCRAFSSARPVYQSTSACCRPYPPIPGF